MAFEKESMWSRSYENGLKFLSKLLEQIHLKRKDLGLRQTYHEAIFMKKFKQQMLKCCKVLQSWDAVWYWPPPPPPPRYKSILLPKKNKTETNPPVLKNVYAQSWYFFDFLTPTSVMDILLEAKNMKMRILLKNFFSITANGNEWN